MKFTDKLSNKLTQLMYGRYGMDQLNWALLICIALVSFIVRPLESRTARVISSYITLLLWALIILRMFSKKYDKRRKENEKFLKLWQPAAKKISAFFNRISDKDHKYCRCSCGTWLRVPKGKGKLKITCPKCRKEHMKKS